MYNDVISYSCFTIVQDDGFTAVLVFGDCTATVFDGGDCTATMLGSTDCNATASL